MDNVIQLRTEAEVLLKKWAEVSQLSSKLERIEAKTRLMGEFDRYVAKRKPEFAVGR